MNYKLNLLYILCTTKILDKSGVDWDYGDYLWKLFLYSGIIFESYLGFGALHFPFFL